MHTLARDDARRLDFNLARFFRLDGALAVDGLAQGIDHAADQRFADGNLRDLAGALDDVALAHGLEVAQEHDADVVLLEVEHQAHDVLAKVEQFAGHGIFQAIDAGDAVAGFEHGAGFGDCDFLVEAFDLPANDLTDFFSANLHGMSFELLRGGPAEIGV